MADKYTTKLLLKIGYHGDFTEIITKTKQIKIFQESNCALKWHALQQQRRRYNDNTQKTLDMAKRVCKL